MIFYGNFQGLEFNSVQIEDFRYAKKLVKLFFMMVIMAVPFRLKFDTFSQPFCLQMNGVLSFQVMFPWHYSNDLKQYGIMGV